MIKLPDSDNYLLTGAVYIKQTEKAIYVDYEGKHFWLPKSQIVYDGTNYENGDDINIELPEWLLKKLDIT